MNDRIACADRPFEAQAGPDHADSAFGGTPRGVAF
jgi:hypothetical protein